MPPTPRQQSSQSDQYTITLAVAPAQARADEQAPLTLTATVKANTPGLPLEGLNIVFAVLEGDAFFEDLTQLRAEVTDPSGVARATLVSGIPGEGYAHAVLGLADLDKQVSNEVSYAFVDGFPVLQVGILQENAFADGEGRIGVDVTVTDEGRPVPDAHLLFKLTNSTAEFSGHPGQPAVEGKTDSNGQAHVILTALAPQKGYVRTSLVSDPKVHVTRDFTFIPKPELALRLVHDGAPADGKSAITALATVTDAQTGLGMADISLIISVGGPITPVGVDHLGGFGQFHTDQDGHAQASFTSTTPSSQLTDIGKRLVVVITMPGAGTTGYQKSDFYTFR